MAITLIKKLTKSIRSFEIPRKATRHIIHILQVGILILLNWTEIE